MKEFEDALQQVFGDTTFSEDLKHRLHLLFELGQASLHSRLCTTETTAKFGTAETMLKEMWDFRERNIFIKCESMLVEEGEFSYVRFALTNARGEIQTFLIDYAVLENDANPAATLFSSPEGRQFIVDGFNSYNLPWEDPS